ncbi:MAG: hypothetical protein PHX83_07920 [Acidobacteriia bacterium]|nr:hypothetical protein [Terriglobia bacterium]
MKRQVFRIACLGICWFILMSLVLHAQTPCVVNGFNNARVDGGYSIIDGSVYTNLRSKLSNPTFFSFASGAAPFPIQLQSGLSTVGSSSLQPGNPTVFVTGWTATSSYTPTEKTNILNAVMNGVSIIVQADDINHSIVDLFGLTQVNSGTGGGSTNQEIADYDNPVMNGPFGRVGLLIPAGFVGQFSGVPGNATLLARNIGGSTGGNTAAVVIFRENALGPTSGRVVILNDSDYAGNSEATSPNGNDATVMFLNALAFACFIPDAPGGANYNTYYFPQIAFNGGFSTVEQSSNGTTGNTIANIQFTNFDDNGSSIGSCSFSTEPGSGTNSCVTNGTLSSPIKTGWAWIRSDDLHAFFAQEKFIQSDGSGNPITAVGVPPAQLGRAFTLVGFLGPLDDIGIAFLALPTDPATAHIQVMAFNSGGSQVGSTGSINLPPGTHTAAFIDGIVSVNRNTLTPTNLSVVITSDQQLAITGLASNDPGFKLSGIPTLPGRLITLFAVTKNATGRASRSVESGRSSH